MSHILILRSKQHNELTRLMFNAATDVLVANNHTYDEILVSNVKELPIGLNVFAESNSYEATICIGIVKPCSVEDSKIHYQEVLRCIYDYSTYFGHLVGNAIAYTEQLEINESELSIYTQEIVSGICEFIKLTREVNSMETNKYASSYHHN